MKTLRLESTDSNIMLSRPIGPIKKNRWIAGILSMLRSDMEQPCLAIVGSRHRDLAPENSDF